MTRRAKPTAGKSSSRLVREIEPQNDPVSVPVPRHLAVPIVVALAALALVAFAPVVDNGFVDLDDYPNIRDNHEFRGLGWSQVVTAFSTPRWAIYQPLGALLLSRRVRSVFGLDPGGYHRLRPAWSCTP